MITPSLLPETTRTMKTPTAIISILFASHAMFAADAPTPGWLAIPQKELTVKMGATLGVITGPSMIGHKAGLTYLPSGTVIKNTDRPYRVESNGGLVVWTTMDSSTVPNAFSFTFKWSDTNVLTRTNFISAFGKFSLQTAFGRSIMFREPKALAICSGVLAFELAGQTNRFVIVSHGFRLTNTDHGGTGIKYTFESTNTTFWPYSKDFLTPLTSTNRAGDALYEAARWLLRTFDEKK